MTAAYDVTSPRRPATTTQFGLACGATSYAAQKAGVGEAGVDAREPRLRHETRRRGDRGGDEVEVVGERELQSRVPAAEGMGRQGAAPGRGRRQGWRTAGT